MTTNNRDMVSLEEAKLLVEYLENGDREQANALVDTITMRESIELFSEVGKLTRQLHDSLNSFQVDEKITNITQDAIPDARSRLTYVIEETEKAANSTMDAVEKSMPLAEGLNDRLTKIMPEWQKLMGRQMELGEFKTLCTDLDKLLADATADSAQLNSLLTEVLMAQGYQDLTGQVIRRVIELVKEVEDNLVSMLTAFGDTQEIKQTEDNAQSSKKETDTVKAEGPIIDAENRNDVVSGQDDVDDLLSSLGF
ncbi:protein phosphatase CheZ [Glaciecola sp. MH2013]|uniref:protein phosphatase CheZ n=1 Tax=Glaciecola sp. MH2013 TaxID=2785524 RepID=UPI00189E50E6|nr:protein phosphatase CheZ [Glaciecola sp. MH2013]MBF7072390.1 protein phosphatase CheZ [Glaciecola sp. MH2013]